MKKITLTLLALVCALCCTFGFAACGEKHEHKYGIAGVCECGEKQPPSEDVQYTISEDGTYAYVSGWKAVKDVYQNPNLPYVMIADTYEGKPVTAIGDGAFRSKEDITSVFIPYGVTSIGDSAFAYSGLWYVTIPNSVTSIGKHAFKQCVSGSGSNGYQGLKSITIPESVTSIGDEAFYDCLALQSVIFPCKVTSMGDRIFNRCHEGLKIYFTGTSKDIENISGYAKLLTSAQATYYYSETEPTEAGTYWHYDTDGVTPVIWSV